MGTPTDVVVAGHICLDMFPSLGPLPPGALEAQGRLFEVGGLRVTTGGVVANVGVALARLGTSVRLLATVGSDLVGQSTLEALRRVSPDLGDHIHIRPGAASSYTIVLARPGQDRLFLHCPGPNQDFTADDVDFEQVSGARWFHFGYPPVMPRLFADNGRLLADILRRAKDAGAVTSLDFTLPDPASPSGQADWPSILRAVLPFVDVFVPSVAEAIFLLRRDLFDGGSGSASTSVSPALLDRMARDLLQMGPAVVGFKLGEHGVMLAGGSAERLRALQTQLPHITAWAEQTVWQAAFDVHVVGTTGAGDAAYAGLITSMLRGFDPQASARLFCATGAAAVSSAEGLFGVPALETVETRFARHPTR